jgi:hypothetical protein
VSFDPVGNILVVDHALSKENTAACVQDNIYLTTVLLDNWEKILVPLLVPECRFFGKPLMKRCFKNASQMSYASKDIQPFEDGHFSMTQHCSTVVL